MILTSMRLNITIHGGSVLTFFFWGLYKGLEGFVFCNFGLFGNEGRCFWRTGFAG